MGFLMGVSLHFAALPSSLQESEEVGSLSYQPRENLSEFIRVIIYAIAHYIENILDLEKNFFIYSFRLARIYWLKMV